MVLHCVLSGLMKLLDKECCVLNCVLLRRYIWVDFNEYDGEWRQGRMSGQGTFVWKTGERYDGEWKVRSSSSSSSSKCVTAAAAAAALLPAAAAEG
jgi:hypothetical protein